MQTFDRILVCLDLTEMDDTLIRYAGFLASVFRPQSITFMHVMQTVDIPEEIAEAFPGLDAPLEQIIRDEITEKVEEGFGFADGVAHEVVVHTGNTTEKIVQYARKHGTGLALMGKKIGYAGEGGVSRKIVGLIPASVLFITETSPRQINRILVRMDFTSVSALAVKTADYVASATGADLECHHVYKLPINYLARESPAQVNRVRKQLEGHVDREYKKFTQKHGVKEGISCGFSMDLHGDEARILYNQAIRNGADMIVVGSMMKSQLANVMLDATTEKLAGTDMNIPLMVVRDRKRSKSFLEALFD